MAEWDIRVGWRWLEPVDAGLKDIELRLLPSEQACGGNPGRREIRSLLLQGKPEDLIYARFGRDQVERCLEIVPPGIEQRVIVEIMSSRQLMRRIMGRRVTPGEFIEALQHYYRHADANTIAHLIFFRRLDE